MFRQFVHFCGRHPYLTALCVAGVACGTAFVTVYSHSAEARPVDAAVLERTENGRAETLDDEKEDETVESEEVGGEGDKETALRMFYLSQMQNRESSSEGEDSDVEEPTNFTIGSDAITNRDTLHTQPNYFPTTGSGSGSGRITLPPVPDTVNVMTSRVIHQTAAIRDETKLIETVEEKESHTS